MEKLNMSDFEMYMDGCDYDVDEVVEEKATSQRRFKNVKERVSSKRKKSYFKSATRMRLLDSLPDVDINSDEKTVVHGMLRSHQLPLSRTRRMENVCGCSIGNKKRLDSAMCQLDDDWYELDVESEIA